MWRFILKIMLLFFAGFWWSCSTPAPVASYCKTSTDCSGNEKCLFSVCQTKISVDSLKGLEPIVLDVLSDGVGSKDAGERTEGQEKQVEVFFEQRKEQGYESEQSEEKISEEKISEEKPDRPISGCSVGSKRSCYPPLKEGCVPKGNSFVCEGRCKLGSQTCKARGIWGDCKGFKAPKTETCNGIDDSCDGKVDEKLNCKCQNGTKRFCYEGTAGCSKGVNGKYSCIRPCKVGEQLCSSGRWERCDGQKLPKIENCNAKDDNCDGKIDEKLSRTCEAKCGKGRSTCSKGSWSPCVEKITPKKEICDGKDNDCDGKIDNLKGQDKPLWESCYTGTSSTKGKGVCKGGKQFCKKGKLGACKDEVKPKKEICNGKDDNCNGQTDEGLNCGCRNGTERQCYFGGSECNKSPSGTYRCLGTCKAGIEKCNGGKWSKICVKEVLPTVEKCGDAKDNDCDGQVDEICGPAYPYALYQQKKMILKYPSSRDLSSFKKSSMTGVATYEFKGRACQNTPLFLTIFKNRIPIIAYTFCDGNKYRVVTKDYRGQAIERDYAAVLPLKSGAGVYGSVRVSSCHLPRPRPRPKPRGCTISRASKSPGSPFSIELRSGGEFILRSKACQANSPVFAVVNDSSSGSAVSFSGHVFVKSVKNGVCTFQTVSIGFRKIPLDFSFWIPDPKKSVWAKISNGKIVGSNSPNTIKSYWHAQKMSKPVSTEVSFRPSANLTGWRSNVALLSPEPSSKVQMVGGVLKPLSNGYGVSILEIKGQKPKQVLGNFSILFVW